MYMKPIKKRLTKDESVQLFYLFRETWNISIGTNMYVFQGMSPEKVVSRYFSNTDISMTAEEICKYIGRQV